MTGSRRSPPEFETRSAHLRRPVGRRSRSPVRRDAPLWHRKLGRRIRSPSSGRRPTTRVRRESWRHHRAAVTWIQRPRPRRRPSAGAHLTTVVRGPPTHWRPSRRRVDDARLHRVHSDVASPPVRINPLPDRRRSQQGRSLDRRPARILSGAQNAPPERRQSHRLNPPRSACHWSLRLLDGRVGG
jgi:hypothetical protein